MIAWIRKRFLDVSMRSSLLVVTVGGVIVLAIGVAHRHPPEQRLAKPAGTLAFSGE